MNDLTTHLLIAAMLAQGVLLSFQIPRIGGSWIRCHWLGKLALLMLAILSLPINGSPDAHGSSGGSVGNGDHQKELRFSDPDQAMLDFVAANLARIRKARHDSPALEGIPTIAGHRAP